MDNWISKVKKGFLFNLSNRASRKKLGQPNPILFGPVGQSGQDNRVGPNLARFFQANKIRVLPGPNFGLVGLAQRARLKLSALHTTYIIA